MTVTDCNQVNLMSWTRWRVSHHSLSIWAAAPRAAELELTWHASQCTGRLQRKSSQHARGEAGPSPQLQGVGQPWKLGSLLKMQNHTARGMLDMASHASDIGTVLLHRSHCNVPARSHISQHSGRMWLPAAGFCAHCATTRQLAGPHPPSNLVLCPRCFLLARFCFPNSSCHQVLLH